MFEFLSFAGLIGLAVWAWKIREALDRQNRRITTLFNHFEDELAEERRRLKVICDALGFPVPASTNELSPRVAEIERIETRLAELTERLDRVTRGLIDRGLMEPYRDGEPAAEAFTPDLTKVEPAVPPAEEVAETPPTAPIQPPAEAAEPLRPVEPLPMETPTPGVPPPLPPSARAARRPPPPPPRRTFDWESFTGVKLFAWLGGFALFLAAAFFVKYSIEHSLISPMLRVVLGLLLASLTLSGGLWLRGKGYDITVHTLCASAIAIFYADVFAAHSFYHFIGSAPAFLFMIVVTTTAFLLSVRLKSEYVAILGLLGGFLTPPLLSTGVDRPFSLFAYIALLDAGLAAVALVRRWGFLVSLGAAGTVLMQFGWTLHFFSVPKAPIALAIYLIFPLLFAAILLLAQRWQREQRFVSLPALILPLLSMGFTAGLLSYTDLAHRPGLVFSSLFLLDSLLAAMALWRNDGLLPHGVASMISFLSLLYWTGEGLTLELLPWGLAFYLAFAVLHSAFPLLLERWRPQAPPFLWGSAYPLLMLIPILVVAGRSVTHSFLVWPFVLLINAVTVVAAITSAAFWMVAVGLLLTLCTAGLWLLHVPNIQGLPGFLGVVGLFALFFFAVGLFLQRRQMNSPASNTALDVLQGRNLPALSAVLPYMLLMMACLSLPITQPAPVFGLGLLLAVLLLGLVRYQLADAVAPITLGSVALMLYTWHFSRFDPSQPMLALPWYLIFFVLFAAFPFCFQPVFAERLAPWACAAVAGPVYFYLVYLLLSAAFGTAWIGLLPAVFALVYLAALIWLVRTVDQGSSMRQTLLALFGGVTLLFVTLILPLQFDREWITIGWALEGVALVWFFRRVPHPGLKLWGGGLLAISFVRLALNPAVLEYHPRTTPILNWYLYAYGAVMCSFWVAARLWRPSHETLLHKKISGWLLSLGTILAFLLVNIEIADYFSTGSTLTFEFSGNLPRDLTYSLAWATFAFLLLVAGVKAGNQWARFGSLGLLLVTAVKVFLHDLWRLGGLYRVSSLVGLAVFLIVVSFLYQRFPVERPPEKP